MLPRAGIEAASIGKPSLFLLPAIGALVSSRSSPAAMRADVTNGAAEPAKA